MEGPRGQAGGGCERPEALANPARAQRRAGLAGEDPSGVGPRRTPGDALGQLRLAPGAQHRDCSLIDGDLPVRIIAFGRVEYVIDLRLPDMHPAPLEVEIRPRQAEQLRPAHARVSA